MLIKNSFRPYLAPNTDKGSPPAEEETLTTQEEVEKLRAEMKAEEEKPPEEEEEKPPEEEEEKPPIKTVEDLTDEEIKELVQSRGLKIPVETPPKEDDPESPPDVPSFRTKAHEEAMRYSKFRGDDGFGNVVLNQEGVDWAEERAMSLHHEHAFAEIQQKQAIQTIQASKPSMIVDTAKTFQEAGMDEPMAQAISKDYIELLTGYGVAAFDDGSGDTDENVKKSKAAQVKHLRTTAYYIARGMEADRQDKAAKEGGQEGDKAHEKVAVATGGGSLWSGVSDSDRKWLEDTWAKERNGGKPPTRKQIDELKEKGVI